MCLMYVPTSVRRVLLLVICFPYIRGLFTVSNRIADWTRATELCNRSLVMSAEVVVSLTDGIPENQALWVGARGKLEPALVSWYGCADFVPYHQVHPNKIFSDNSVARCLHHCSRSLHKTYTLFALQGERCYCFPGLQSVKPVSTACNISCPGNLHGDCGGERGTMSIYMEYEPYHGDHFDNHSDVGGLCMSVRQDDAGKLTWKYQWCDSRTAKGYLCILPESKYAKALSTPGGRAVNWYEAVDLCRGKNGRIQYDPPVMTAGIIYWTSLKRSFWVKWTNQQDSSYPLCGAVQKRANGQVSLTVKSCHTKLKYVCNTNIHTSATEDSDTSDWTIYVIVVSVALVIVASVVGIGYILWKKRVCVKKPRTASFSNSLYSEIIPGTSQPLFPNGPSQGTVPVSSLPENQQEPVQGTQQVPVQGTQSKLGNQTVNNVENHANNQQQVRPPGSSYDYVDVGDVGASISSQTTDTNGRGNHNTARETEQKSQMESKTQPDSSTNVYDTTASNCKAQSKTPTKPSTNVYDTTASVQVRMQAIDNDVEPSSENQNSQTYSKGNMHDLAASVCDGKVSDTQADHVYDTTTKDSQNKGNPTFTVLNDTIGETRTRNAYNTVDGSENEYNTTFAVKNNEKMNQSTNEYSRLGQL